MHPSNRRVLFALLAVAFGFYGLAFVQASARQAEATPTAQALQNVHPVAIHAGTCANSGQEPAFALANAAPLVNDNVPLADLGSTPSAGQPVLAAEATVKKKLDDLTKSDEPYALVVHETEITYDTFVACGDITGSLHGGKLVVGVVPLNGSGIAGIAIFDKDETGFLGLGDEETKVHAYLIDVGGSSATGGAPPPAATPAATEATTSPTATEAPTQAPPQAPPQAPTEATAATPAAGQSANAVTIGLYDIYFQPNSITIPANTPVTVTLTNNGAAQHNFSLTTHGNPNLASNLAQSVDLAAGQSQSITLNLPAGTYYFFCDVPGHEAAGMRGSIVAQDGAAIATAEATVAIPSA